MATFGFPDLKIELDTTEGGSLGDMSAYVTEISGWSKESLTEEITAAGDSADRWAKVGTVKKGEIVLTGPYDNTTRSAAPASERVAVSGTVNRYAQTLVSFTGSGSGESVTFAVGMKRTTNNP